MNILSNKFVQAIIILAVLFGLIMVTGINFTLQVGSNGVHFSVDRVE